MNSYSKCSQVFTENFAKEFNFTKYTSKMIRKFDSANFPICHKIFSFGVHILLCWTLFLDFHEFKQQI